MVKKSSSTTTISDLQKDLDFYLNEMTFLCDDMCEILNFDKFKIHDDESFEQLKNAKSKTNKTYMTLKKIENLTNELKLFGT